MFSIYGLKELGSNLIMYVGKSDNPAVRFFNHIRCVKDSKTPKDMWIQSVYMAGSRIEMVIIENCDECQDAYERESFWINYFHRINPALTNAVILSNPSSVNPSDVWSIDGRQVITENMALLAGKQNYAALSLSESPEARKERNRRLQTNRTERLKSAAQRLGFDTIDQLAAALLGADDGKIQLVTAALRGS